MDDESWVQRLHHFLLQQRKKDALEMHLTQITMMVRQLFVGRLHESSKEAWTWRPMMTGFQSAKVFWEEGKTLKQNTVLAGKHHFHAMGGNVVVVAAVVESHLKVDDSTAVVVGT